LQKANIFHTLTSKIDDFMKISRPFLALAVLVFLLPISGYSFSGNDFLQQNIQHNIDARYASGEKKHAGFFTRLEIGFILPQYSSTFNQHYSAVNPLDGSTLVDTVINIKAKSNPAYGGYLGISFPLTYLGGKAALGLSVGVKYIMCTYDLGNVTPYSSSVSPVSIKSSIATTQENVPISLDVKFGNDANTDRNTRYCFTYGMGVDAGMYTAVNTLSSSSSSTTGSHTYDAVMSVNPFMKAEVGIFMGMLFKVRATYDFGTIKLADDNNQYQPTETQHTTFKNTSRFELSLILLPLSATWHRADWWKH